MMERSSVWSHLKIGGEEQNAFCVQSPSIKLKTYMLEMRKEKTKTNQPLDNARKERNTESLL
jgi:hypothetical protein